MKVVKGLSLLFLGLSLALTSCKDDNNNNDNGSDNNNNNNPAVTGITGTYSGTLNKASVQDITNDALVLLEKKGETYTITLKNFSFEGKLIGDIPIDNVVAVEDESTGDYTLTKDGKSSFALPATAGGGNISLTLLKGWAVNWNKSLTLEIQVDNLPFGNGFIDVTLYYSGTKK